MMMRNRGVDMAQQDGAFFGFSYRSVLEEYLNDIT